MSTTDIQSCEDALRLLASHLDGELEPPDRAQMDRHLEACRSCYSRAEFEKRLKERLVELGREPIRPELAHRVQTLIRDFTVEGGDRPSAGSFKSKEK